MNKTAIQDLFEEQDVFGILANKFPIITVDATSKPGQVFVIILSHLSP